MGFQISISTVNAEFLRSADAIFGVDPARVDYREMVWGQESVPDWRPESPHGLRIVEVILDSADLGQRKKLRDLVLEAKGSLPPGLPALA